MLLPKLGAICALLFCLNSYLVFAQADNLKIVFQPIHVSATMGKENAPALYEMILQQLMELNKFTIVNRTPEMWKAIEDELKAQDFINSKTALNLGKMSGAKFLLSGDISSFSSEQKSRTTADNKVNYYFSSVVVASLKMIDLESGEYKEAVTSEITVDEADREASVHAALQKTASELVLKLSKKFLIHGRIKSMRSQDVILINKGSLDGVKLFAAFHVLDSRQEPPAKIATLKITSISPNESTGRLLKGDFSKLSADQALVESPEYESNVIAVENKTKNLITINGGANLNIKKGDLFSISDSDEIKTLVYIKEVKSEYATGKILEGYNHIVKGTTLSEVSKYKSVRRSFVGFGYKSSLGTTIHPTESSGIASITNKNGNFNVDTNYLNQYSTISNINVYALTLGVKNLTTDVTTSLNFDIYDMSPLNNWIGHLDVQYEYAIIQEKLFLSIGGGIGYGRLKQTVPNGVIETISGGKSNDLHASSIYLSGITDLRYKINRFILHAGFSYDFIRFNKWQYTIDNGDKEVAEIAPAQIIPYSDVNLSGVYYKVGIAYLYKK